MLLRRREHSGEMIFSESRVEALDFEAALLKRPNGCVSLAGFGLCGRADLRVWRPVARDGNGAFNATTISCYCLLRSASKPRPALLFTVQQTVAALLESVFVCGLRAL